MRINENVAIVGQSVLLLPYQKSHVEKYHSWMKSPEIQKLTASEPLSLAEEYAMQRSWREDDDKLTFIIVNKALWDKFGMDENHLVAGETYSSKKETSCMVGDVNLFLNDNTSRTTAEIEIMIAETKSRKKGLATESLQLIMAYAVTQLGIDKFVAKIGCENTPSIRLFTQKLGFYETDRSQVFDEITLVKTFNLSNGRDVTVITDIGIRGFDGMIIEYSTL